MKYVVILILVLLCNLCVIPGRAQSFSLVKEALSLQPDKEYENVLVKEMYADSLSSVFCIWIKKEVKKHKHEFHSEQVYVLEGTANMWLNSEKLTLKPGMLISIPQGTAHKVVVEGALPLKVLSIQSPHFDGKDRVLIND